MATITTKQPSETILVPFNFGKRTTTAETIDSINSVVADPNDMTVDAGTLNGKYVDVLVTGGLSPTRPDEEYLEYKVTVIATTSAGQVLEEDITIGVQSV